MPFAGYKDFEDCVRKNQDKRNPKAYCASIMREVESGRQAPGTLGKGGAESATEAETPPKAAAHTGWWKGHL